MPVERAPSHQYYYQHDEDDCYDEEDEQDENHLMDESRINRLEEEDEYDDHSESKMKNYFRAPSFVRSPSFRSPVLGTQSVLPGHIYPLGAGDSPSASGSTMMMINHPEQWTEADEMALWARQAGQTYSPSYHQDQQNMDQMIHHRGFFKDPRTGFWNPRPVMDQHANATGTAQGMVHRMLQGEEAPIFTAPIDRRQYEIPYSSNAPMIMAPMLRNSPSSSPRTLDTLTFTSPQEHDDTSASMNMMKSSPAEADAARLFSQALLQLVQQQLTSSQPTGDEYLTGSYPDEGNPGHYSSSPKRRVSQPRLAASLKPVTSGVVLNPDAADQQLASASHLIDQDPMALYRAPFVRCPGSGMQLDIQHVNGEYSPETLSLTLGQNDRRARGAQSSTSTHQFTALCDPTTQQCVLRQGGVPSENPTVIPMELVQQLIDHGAQIQLLGISAVPQ